MFHKGVKISTNKIEYVNVNDTELSGCLLSVQTWSLLIFGFGLISVLQPFNTF